MNAPKKCRVDGFKKSLCFLCLQTNFGECESGAKSLVNLNRYIKVDLSKLPLESEEETELIVVMCGNCCQVVNKFDSLYQELELIILKLNSTVETIYEMMTVKDTPSSADCSQLMAASLRNEIMQKCANKVETYLPQVHLEEVSDAEDVAIKMEPAEPSYSIEHEEEMMDPLAHKESRSSPSSQVRDQDPLEDGIETGHDKLFDKIKNKNTVKKLAPSKMMVKCSVCGKHVRSWYLSRHQRTHTGEKPLSCPYCPEKIKDDGVLRKHKLLKHQAILFADCKGELENDQVFEAAIGRLFENNITCKQATSKKARRGSYACNYCSKSFGNKPDAVCHMIGIHFEIISSQLKEILKDKSLCQVDTPFGCPECNMNFEKLQKQQLHLLDTHFMTLFKDCKIQLNFSGNGENILRAIVEEKVLMRHKSLFECGFCGHQHRSKKVITFHVIEAHRQIIVSNLTEWDLSATSSVTHSLNGSDQHMDLHYENSPCMRSIVEEEIDFEVIVKTEAENEDDDVIILSD